jgi:hypothetical protein
MKPQPISTRYVLMNCPVCSEDIVGVVTAQVVLGAGSYDPAKNTLNVPVTTKATRFDVVHNCSGPLADAEASR